MSWDRVDQYYKLYDRVKKKDTTPPKYPVVYWHPQYLECVIAITGRDIGRLRKVLSRGEDFPDNIAEAGRRGFPIYLQPFRGNYSNKLLYDSITKKEITGMTTFQCRKYDRRVSPPICIANLIRYPKAPSQDTLDEIEFLKKKMDAENDEVERKRLRRQISKKRKALDPYPDCRSCRMAKRLNTESCLGISYNPILCKECKNQVECCHLMRMRISKILDGKEVQVKDEILDKAPDILDSLEKPKILIEKEASMAKTKKKQEEEVKDETQEMSAKEKAAARRKARKAAKEAEAPKEESKKSSKKKAAKEEAPAPAKTEKPLSQKAQKLRIKELLDNLQEAKDAKDKNGAAKIRAELRKLGFRLSDQK